MGDSFKSTLITVCHKIWLMQLVKYGMPNFLTPATLKFTAFTQSQKRFNQVKAPAELREDQRNIYPFFHYHSSVNPTFFQITSFVDFQSRVGVEAKW